MHHIEQTLALSATDIELRDRLTGLSKDFFLKQGYNSSTMDQVAKKARVSKKTLYRLFRNKEAVLRAVIHSIMNEIEDITTPLFTNDTEPFAVRFERLVVQISPQFANLRSLSSMKEMRDVSPNTYEEFEVWRRIRCAVLVGMVTRARDRGEISTVFDLNEMIEIYGALHNACMDYSIAEDQGVPAKDVYVAFSDVFLNGILEQGYSGASKQRHTV